MTVKSFISGERSLSDSRSLDVLGICDPREKKAKMEKNKATGRNFVNTERRLSVGAIRTESVP